MTDICSRPNTYFSPAVYNNGATDILANFDITQIAPFVQKASDYVSAIDKARITLNIPLTNANLPLKTYSIILRQTLPNGTVAEGQAFVRQIGATNKNFIYNLDSVARTFGKYVYTPAGVLTSIFSYSISPDIALGYGQMVVDDYENLYLACNTDGGTLYPNLVIFSTVGNVIANYSFDAIQSIAIAPNQTIYIVDEAFTGSVVQVYTNVNSLTAVELTYFANITTNKAGARLSNISTVCVDQHILVGYNSNHCTLYDTTLAPLNDFQPSGIQHISAPSAMLSAQDRFVIVDQGIADDFLYGQNSSTSNTVDAITGAILYPVGTYAPPSSFQVIGNVYYAVTTSGNTYQAPYSNGVFSEITTIVSSIPQTAVAITSDQLHIAGFNGSNNKLCFLGVDNLNPPNYYLSDDKFKISPSLGIFDITFQNSSLSTCYAIGADNRIYVSENITPKLLYTGKFRASGEGEVVRAGFGYTSPNSSNGVSHQLLQCISFPDVAFQPPTYNSGVCYDEVSNQYFGIAYDSSTPPKMYLMKTTSTQLAPTSYIQINTGQSGNFIPNGVFVIPNVAVCVATCEEGGLNCVSMYDLTTLATLTTGVMTIGGDTFNYTATSWYDDVNAKNYVGMAGGTDIFVFDVTNPSMPINVYIDTVPLISVITNMPRGSTLLTINNFKAYQPLSGQYQGYFVATSSLANAGQADLFCSFSFDSGYDAISANVLFSGLALDTGATFLTSNNNMNEIYIKNSNNSIAIYNVITGTFTSRIIPDSSYTLFKFMYVPNTISGTYTFTNLPTTNVTNFTSLCFGQKNPNQLYAINTVDSLVYETFTNAGVPLVFTKVAGSTIPLTSIGGAPTIPTSYNSTATCFNLTAGQTQVGVPYNNVGKLITSVAKNALSFGGNGELIIGVKGVSAVSMVPATFTQQWINNATFWGNIYAKDGEDTFAGMAPVWTYAVLINALNATFIEAHSRLLANGGTITDIPTVALNVQNGFCTMNYSSDYTTIGNGILFNSQLHGILYFESTPDLLDLGYFLNTLLPASTSVMQEVLSIWKFNQLDKIIFQSNTLFFLGANAFGQNNASNQFADFNVPVSSQGYLMNNISNVLDIQPNFLNPLVLSSSEPISRIQVQVLYQYLDGSQYPLYIPYGQNFSCKIIFNKRF